MGDLEATFRSYDESGEISTGELGPNDMVRYFRKVLKLSKHECPDKALRIAFHAMDDDGSGKMSIEELLEFIKYCNMEPGQKSLPSRVPGLIGGMRGEIPKRIPSSRPGTFLGAPLSRVPFCLNGRDTEPGGRLYRSTRCGLIRSKSDSALHSLDNRELVQHVSQEMSTTLSLQELDSEMRADETARPMS